MSNTHLLSDLRPTSEKEMRKKREKFYINGHNAQTLKKKMFVHYGSSLMLLKRQAKFKYLMIVYTPFLLNLYFKM